MHGAAVTAAVNAAMVKIVREHSGGPAVLVQLAQIASVARLYYPGSSYEMSGRLRP